MYCLSKIYFAVSSMHAIPISESRVFGLDVSGIVKKTGAPASNTSSAMRAKLAARMPKKRAVMNVRVGAFFIPHVLLS